MIKQRKESLVQFQAGNRPDLVAKESAEIALLQSYMPAQLTAAEIDALIAEAIAADRRRQHQGHGQGDGHRQGQGAGPGRHGRRRAPKSKPSSAVDRNAVHGRPYSTAVHRRNRRALRYRRDHRCARAAEEIGARIQGLLPVS